MIKCKDNGGFEDQLTVGGLYTVEDQGVNSFSVKDDKGVKRWYGAMKFEVSV